MLRRVAFILLGVWAILSVAALSHFLYDTARLEGGLHEWTQSEVEVRLSWELMILNFPASIGVAIIGQGLQPNEAPHPVAVWTILTLSGLVQWLLVVPWLLNLIRGRLTRSHSDSTV